VPCQTDDGETILMHYTGLVQQTDAFKQAAEANQSTEWKDQYMRLTMRFDAGAERYCGSRGATPRWPENPTPSPARRMLEAYGDSSEWI
jgi:uncharacterized protein DUF3237